MKRSIFAVSLILFFGFVFNFLQFCFAPFNTLSKPMYYFLKPGSGTIQLAYDLHQKKLIKNIIYFKLLAHLLRVNTKLQTGEYQLTSDTTPMQLLKDMSQGKIALFNITLVEGNTLKIILTQMADNSKIHYFKLTPDEIAKASGIAHHNPEGWFYPDTYQFKAYTSSLAILQKAHLKMQRALNNAWQTRQPGLAFKTPYQALIAASIIEKEAYVQHDRALISSVIQNRLQKNMRLQMDPTVIYALGNNYHTRLTHKDLSFDSPYNTYRHRGLPPTPIASPGFASLFAALHPAKTEYLYFVAKGDGSHIFSKTLTGQNRAIDFALQRTELKNTQNSCTLPFILWIKSCQTQNLYH